MESDLQLIEMAGEDDSLLQQQLPDPNETSSSSATYFNCSPLHPPRFDSKGLKDGVDMEKHSCSSSKSSNNKENINMNNLEMPKLGMEPMQMKRRKKGGGYNLRKSLAWDRAFFTDEGILDPLELSLITGISGNSRGGQLETINEDGTSFSADTKSSNDPEGFKEALYKELPDKNQLSVDKSEKAGSSMGKHNLLTQDKVKRKVLSAHGANRIASRVGSCPQSLSLSSLKRPANSSTVKTPKKESKIPKLPAPKPVPCYSKTTQGSMTANQSRLSQIPKPTIGIHKNVGLKSFKNVNSSQKKAKTASGNISMPAKDPDQTTLRHQGFSQTNLSSKAASSAKSRSLQVGKVNSGSETIPDQLQLCEIQEGSASLAVKDLTQLSATKLTNPLSEAAWSVNSGSSQLSQVSSGLMISDRLHACEGPEGSAALRVSCLNNLCTSGAQPMIQAAKQSGLRLPSPSLGFFDQRRAMESDSLLHRKSQAYKTSSDPNAPIKEKLCELRPSIVPVRTSIKSNNTKESVTSGVLTSTKQCSSPPSLNAHSSGTQLNLSPSYTGTKSSDVSDSIITRNLERRIVQKVDINIQYECGSSEHKAHKTFKPEQRIDRHVDQIEMEKIAQKDQGEMKNSDNQLCLESGFTKQTGEGNPAGILSAANGGYNKVSRGSPQLMCQENDQNVNLVPGTKGKLVQQNQEDKLQNSSAILKPTSGQSILHQEHTLSTMLDSSANFLLNLGIASREQAAAEKSDAPEVNPESHVDSSCEEVKDNVSEVTGKSLTNEIGKKGDSARVSICAGSEFDDYHVSLQTEKSEQEISEGLHVEADSGYHVNNPCLEMKENVSIIFGESQKDEAGIEGNTGAKDANVILDTFRISLQNEDIGKGNDGTVTLGVCSRRSFVGGAGSLASHETLSAVHFNLDPDASIESQTRLGDVGTNDLSPKCIEEKTLCLSAAQKSESYLIGKLVNCTEPEESSSLEGPQFDDAIENIHYSAQGRSGWSDPGANSLGVQGQTQDGADVNLMPEQIPAEEQVGFEEFAPVSGDDNHSSPLHLTRDVKHINEAASVGDDASLNTEKLLHGTQCAEAYLQSLEVERLDMAAVTREAEFEIHEESSYQKSQGVKLSKESVVGEDSQHSHVSSISDANSTIQGCTVGIGTTTCQFLSAYSVVEEAGAVGNFSKTHVEDARLLVDGDILIESCSQQTSVVQELSLQIIDCSETFEERPQFSNTIIEDEQVSQSNHQLLTDSDKIQEEDVSKSVRNVIEQDGFHESDPKISNNCDEYDLQISNDSDECDRLLFEYATSSFPVVDLVAEHHENATDEKMTDRTACCELALLSGIDSESKDQMEGLSVAVNYPSAVEESCSLPREVVLIEVLEGKPASSGSCFDIGQALADDPNLHMRDCLSPTEIPDLKESQLENVLESVMVVPGRSISNVCGLETLNASGMISLTAQDNVLNFDRDDHPCIDNAPQKLDSESKDQMEGLSTPVNYPSAVEESFSLPQAVAVHIEVLEEKPASSGLCFDVGQTLASDPNMHTGDSLTTAEIPDLKESQLENVLENVMVVRGQSISNVCVLETLNASGGIPMAVQDNVLKFDTDDQPCIDNAPQGSVVIMPLVKCHEHITEVQSGNSLESSGQDPSKFNSNSLGSQHPATGVRIRSTFCSITRDLCPVVGGDKSVSTNDEFSIGTERPKTNFVGEAEGEILEDGNNPKVGEFCHELHQGSGLNKSKDATVSSKNSITVGREDKPLVICPPDAVPFSDEWLAAFEAAGEEILTMKCGAVQHSPPEKSHPEPGPWSPVKKKANQIGPYDCTKYTNMPANPE